MRMTGSEAALAHTLRDAGERAYARSDQFEKRGKLMDQWARWCLSGAERGQELELRA